MLAFSLWLILGGPSEIMMPRVCYPS